MSLPDTFAGGSEAAVAGSIHLPVPRRAAATILTPDSILGLSGARPEDYYVRFEEGPLWLPPPLAAKILATRKWRITVDFDGEDLGVDSLSGSWDESVYAGAELEVTILDGVRTTEPADPAPVWESVADAVAAKVRREGEDYFGSGRPATFRLLVSGEGGSLDVSVLLRGMTPGWRAETPPTSTSPMRWAGGEGLVEGWMFDVQIRATVTVGLAPGSPEYISARLFYDDQWVGADYGQPWVYQPGGAADSAIQISLLHQEYFE